MSTQSPTQQDIQEDVQGNGKQLRTIPSIRLITEEGNQEDAQQPQHSTDNPPKAQSDIQSTTQQPEEQNTLPPQSAEPSPPAPPPSAPPTPENPTISPLGRPPPNTRHHYLKEKWPGQPLCHLCHKPYKTTTRAIRALPCGDIFHRACIDHLLGHKDTRCPSCGAQIPAQWYLPHKYDPTKPAGGACLCHPVDKRGNNGIRKVMAGVKSEGEDASSTPSGVLARKRYKRAKGCVRRWILGWRTERRWVSYKTESGQTRYFEGEKRAAQRR